MRQLMTKAQFKMCVVLLNRLDTLQYVFQMIERIDRILPSIQCLLKTLTSCNHTVLLPLEIRCHICLDCNALCYLVVSLWSQSGMRSSLLAKVC